jgi:hypothetical protein
VIIGGMKENISIEQIEEAFSRSYWGESFYGGDNRLFPQQMAVEMAATNVALYLLKQRFPSLQRRSSLCQPFNQATMTDVLLKRGFVVTILENQEAQGLWATRGFRFRIERRDRGFFASVGGWSSPGSYTAGIIEDIADWMYSIAEQFDVILNYVEGIYNLEQQKVLVDGLLSAAAQAYLPVGLRCEVWHERYMNYAKGTRRLIGILSEEGTIGDTILQDETNLKNAIEKLLQNKDIRRYMKEEGLLLSNS